jgi:hypothetical protein
MALPPNERHELRAALAARTKQTRASRAAALRRALAPALMAAEQRTRTGACCAVDRAMNARCKGDDVTPPALSAAADRLLAANDGAPLGWRQLLRIAKESGLSHSLPRLTDKNMI